MEPEAIIISFLCTIAGVVGLWQLHAPELADNIPIIIQVVWNVIIIVGGGTRVVGLITQRIGIDVIGCALLGPVATVYGVFNFLLGTVSLVGGLLILGVGVMSLVRWRYYYEIVRGTR